MTRTTVFGNRSFSANRWAVGHQAAPIDEVGAYWARENYKSAKRTAKYKASRVKARLRPVLMLQNPHCTDCGLRLQMVDNRQLNYACVMGTENAVLCCLPCSEKRSAGKPVADEVGVNVLVETEVTPC